MYTLQGGGSGSCHNNSNEINDSLGHLENEIQKSLTTEITNTRKVFTVAVFLARGYYSTEHTRTFVFSLNGSIIHGFVRKSSLISTFYIPDDLLYCSGN